MVKFENGKHGAQTAFNVKLADVLERQVGSLALHVMTGAATRQSN
jgi:hypothetical protein